MKPVFLMITIKQNAIFVADSHYNKKNLYLKTLLDDIQSSKIKTEQLILMGDIFDFLSSYVSYFVKINQQLIDQINNISQTIEVVYFEGNHDFLIQKLFPFVKVYKREQQPLILDQNGKKTALSHGDIFTPFGYNLYTSIIRNKYLLKFLNFFDINGVICKKIENSLMKKNICKKFKTYDTFIEKRVNNYKVDLVIEGHFHQNIISKNYINIPSLCCDKQYIQYVNNQFIQVWI